MKIRRLEIDGFGLFAGHPIDGLSDRLTVIEGPNEAGKSTLLAFIRTVLFGFPERNRDSYFPALNGGRHGGRIVLEDDGRRFVVERHAGPRGGEVVVSAPDGKRAGTDLLRQLLGNASRDLFENIFAFDLEKLFSATVLQQPDVKDAIYSAGIGAVGLLPALRRLQKQQDAIYTPRGSSQPVANTLKKLEEIDVEIGQIRAAAAQYEPLQQERERVRNEIGHAEGDLAKAEQQLAQAERLRKAWPPWITLQEREAQIALIPDRQDFPADAIAKLESATRECDGAITRLQEAKHELETKRQALAAIEVNGAVLAAATAIEALRLQAHDFAKSVHDLPERRAEAEALVAELTGQIQTLGPGWDDARVAAFDSSLPVRSEVVRQAEALAHSTRAEQEAALRLDTARQTLRVATDEGAAARQEAAALPAPVLDADALRNRRLALAQIRQQIVRFDDARARLRQEEQQIGELQAQQPPSRRGRSESGEQPEEGTADKRTILLRIVRMPLRFAGALLRRVRAAVFVPLAALFARLAGRVAIDERPWTALDQRIGTQEQRRAAAAADVERLRAELTVLAARAEIPFAESVTAIDAAEHELESAQQQFDTWQRRQERLAEAVRRLAAPEREVAEAEARFRAAAESRREAEAAWQAWREGRALPLAWRPEEITELFSRLDALRAKQRQVRDRRDRVHAITQDIEEFRALALPLVERHAVGPPAPNDAQIGAAVEELIRRLDEAREAQRRREALTEQGHALRQRVIQAENDRAAAERRLAELLDLGGARDSDELRQAAEEQAHRRRLAGEYDKELAALMTLSGPGQALEQLRATLKGVTAESLEDEVKRLTDRIAALEQERRALQNRHGQLDQQIADLEQEPRAATLREERNVRREALRTAAEDWGTLAIAHWLLEQAREKYERERKPGVVRRAEAYFAHITGGRYSQLYTPLEEQQIDVVGADGARKPTAALSRGTQEQLYLALRFGLIEEFGAHSRRLPVIVDDILVNFDPARAQRTAEAFWQLAGEHQVIVFTCHPSTVDLFRAVAPETTVLLLDGERPPPARARRPRSQRPT